MKNLNEILISVLGVSVESVADEMSPDSVASWDSFSGLMLVSALEKNFNIKFTFDEITSVKNVGDIKKMLIKHGVEKF